VIFILRAASPIARAARPGGLTWRGDCLRLRGLDQPECLAAASPAAPIPARCRKHLRFASVRSDIEFSRVASM